MSNLARRVRNLFSGRSTEDAVQTGENQALVGDDTTENQSSVSRKLKTIGNAIKKPFDRFKSWRRSDSTFSSLNSEDSDNDYFTLPDNNPLQNRYRLKKLRTLVGLNNGWKVYDSVDIKDEKIRSLAGKEDKNRHYVYKEIFRYSDMSLPSAYDAPTCEPKIDYATEPAPLEADDQINAIKSSVFVFDKNAVEGEDREMILRQIRKGVLILETLSSLPYFLPVKHPLEEGYSTMAFATEPVAASLMDCFPSQTPTTSRAAPTKPVRELDDIERSYGIQQIIDGLMYLHYQKKIVFLNICPSNIIITERGVWKLFGFELAKNITLKPKNYNIFKGTVNIAPWSVRTSQFSKPDLDFTSPEVLMGTDCSSSTDIYSLGALLSCIYNDGHTLIQAQKHPIKYLKRFKYLEQSLNEISGLSKNLRDIIKHMMKPDPADRPHTQSLARFCENVEVDYSLTTAEHRPIIDALQFCEDLSQKSIEDKHRYFSINLVEVLPHVPVKLHWSLIWPTLVEDMFKPYPLKSLLQPLSFIARNSSPKHFKKHVIPLIIRLINARNNPSKFFLESLDEFMTTAHYPLIKKYLLPSVYIFLNSDYERIKQSSVIAIVALSECIAHTALIEVVNKLHDILNTTCTLNTVVLIFKFYEKVMRSLDYQTVFETLLGHIISYSYQYSLVFHHSITHYSRILYSYRYCGITSKFVEDPNPYILNKIMTSKEYAPFKKLLFELADTVKETNCIMVILIDDTDTTHEQPDSSNLRSRSESSITSFTQWILARRARRRYSSIPGLARPSSEFEMAAMIRLSEPETVPPSYEHSYVDGLEYGTYIDYDGTKKVLPNWGYMAIPCPEGWQHTYMIKWLRTVMLVFKLRKSSYQE